MQILHKGKDIPEDQKQTAALQYTKSTISWIYQKFI